MSPKPEWFYETAVATAAPLPVKPPEIRQRGQEFNITGDVLWEWCEYLLSAEGADQLRIGTETISPIAPSCVLIRFENRLGYSLLQPLRQGRNWGPARQVEVASAKLGGYDAYHSFAEALIHELYRAGAEKVFDFAGHTSTEARGPGGRRSPLFCMHYLLQKRVELITALELVCERPHLSLCEQSSARRLAAISRSGKDLVVGLLRGRRGWARADHLAAGKAMGGFLPSHIETAESEETTDNPENRFVLGLVEMVVGLIRSFQVAPWWPEIPRARRTILLELGHELDGRIMHPVFEKVSAMRGVPAQSRVLTRRDSWTAMRRGERGGVEPRSTRSKSRIACSVSGRRRRALGLDQASRRRQPCLG